MDVKSPVVKIRDQVGILTFMPINSKHEIRARVETFFFKGSSKKFMIKD